MRSLSAKTCREQVQRKSAIEGSLFDHLVGAGKQRWWHGQAQRLGGFQVDDKFVLGRRLHWKITRLLAPKDAINVSGGFAPLIDLIDAVIQKSTICCVILVGVNCGHMNAGSQLDD